MKKGTRGQHTIEYLLLLAVVVSFFVLFTAPGSNYRQGIQTALTCSTGRMVTTTGNVWRRRSGYLGMPPVPTSTPLPTGVPPSQCDDVWQEPDLTGGYILRWDRQQVTCPGTFVGPVIGLWVLEPDHSVDTCNGNVRDHYTCP